MILKHPGFTFETICQKFMYGQVASSKVFRK